MRWTALRCQKVSVGTQSWSFGRDRCSYSGVLKSTYLRKSKCISMQKVSLLIYPTPQVYSFATFALKVCQPVYNGRKTLQACDCLPFFFKIQSQRQDIFPFLLTLPIGQRQTYSLCEEAEILERFLPLRVWLYMSCLLSSEKCSALKEQHGMQMPINGR